MVRLFSKPKPNLKMPQGEDIFRNPKELEELKAKVKPEEYLKSLYEQIFKIETALEQKKVEYVHTLDSLARESEARKRELWKDIDLLENALGIKRAEKAELDKPFVNRSKELDEREMKLIEKESENSREAQRTFEREIEAERKLTDVQSLSDQLGEARVRVMVREKTLETREKALKDNENRILLGFEELAQKRNDVQAELLPREEAVTLRELNIASKEQNLVQREEQLIKDKLLVQSQRQALLAAKNDNHHPNSRTASHRHPSQRPAR